MPRGKYVNHKGRNRHFTSPEELQQENDEETSSEESSDEEGGEDGGAPGGSAGTARVKPKKPVKKKTTTKAAAASSDDDSDEDDDDESEDDNNKNKGVASLIEIENPNRAVKKATVKVSAIKLDDDEDAAAPEKPQLSRREREQLEKQKARQRYEKLHAAGKTAEAKADLARLALIRQQRADAAAKREADKKKEDAKKAGKS